jgi:hypothetical protein
MCRSIVTLRGETPATDDEVRAASLQFVRKVSGYRQPSQTNEEVFNHAVDEVAHSVRHLLDSLVSPPGARQPARAPSRDYALRRAEREQERRLSDSSSQSPSV